MSLLDDLRQATIKGDADGVVELVHQALDEGLEADRIIQDGLIPAMDYIGDEFAEGKLYVPEMLISARAMQAGMELVKPLLVEGQVETLAKVVIGSVQGDLHDIGKNLVGMMLEGAGAEIIDLGTDVSPASFVEAVREEEPDFLAMSTLLTTTMQVMEKTVAALADAGLRDSVKVLIGGAPVTKDYCSEIGADGYGTDAAAAVSRVRELVNG
jgi:5-methyltetrahydrofolate--homocysteine methyltransferase